MRQPDTAQISPTSGNASLRLSRVKPRVLTALLGAVFVFGLLGHWLIERANNVTTSDARVAADMLAISAEISGTITASHVRVGDRVAAGDLIYEIDDREQVFRLEAQVAQRDGLLAQIEQTRMRVGLISSKSGTQIDATQAGERSAIARVNAARSDLATRQEEFDRFDKLFERGRVTQDTLDSAANALEAAKQALRAAEADVSSATAKTRQAILSVDDSNLVAQDLQILEAQVRRANAQIEEQKILIQKHKIRSPIDGVIDELFFDVGERTLQGFRVVLLHNPDDVWISANIKETAIRKIKVGDRVDIHVDSLPNDKLTGSVSTIRELTISEMGLMPNPNASGVFTKITQRIPIRIDLDDSDAQLRPGSMVQVKIARSSDSG